MGWWVSCVCACREGAAEEYVYALCNLIAEEWTTMVKSVQWQLGEDGVSELCLCFVRCRVRNGAEGNSGITSREGSLSMCALVNDTYMSSVAIKDQRRKYRRRREGVRRAALVKLVDRPRCAYWLQENCPESIPPSACVLPRRSVGCVCAVHPLPAMMWQLNQILPGWSSQRSKGF